MGERVTMKSLRELAKDAFGPDAKTQVLWGMGCDKIIVLVGPRRTASVSTRIDVFAVDRAGAMRTMRDILRGIRDGRV